MVGIDTGVFKLDEVYPAITMQVSHILGYNMSSMVVGVGEDSPLQSRHFILFVIKLIVYFIYKIETKDNINLF